MSVSATTPPIASRWTRAWSGRRRWPLVSVAGGTIAAALVLLPLTFLAYQAQRSGWGELERVLLRHSVAVLLWNTVRLALACTVLCAVLGVAAAWCVERTTLPARRLWAVVLVLPLGVPDFVTGFGWVSIDPALHGYLAAVMIMTLALYPLVYLPVAGALANLDAGLEEAARSLGLGPWQAFWKVTLRQIWPAILGGCLLVALALLAEYGAFEIVQYQTFTVEIFTEFKLGFDTAAACALSLVLVLLSLAALGGELSLAGRGRAWRAGPGARRIAPKVILGRRSAPALAGLATLTGLALGVPLGSLVYWMLRGKLHDPAVDLDPRRGRAHRRLQRRRGGDLHGAGGARERPGDPPPQPPHRADRAAGVSADGAPRHRDRARARVVLGALRARALPERVRADPRLLDPVPAAGARRRALGDGAGAAAPGGGGTLAGPPSRQRVDARDAAADRPRHGRGLRARVHLLGDRADRDVAAAPDRGEHTRNPVLGVHLGTLLRGGGAICGVAGRYLGDPRLRAQPPPQHARPGGAHAMSRLTVRELSKGYADAEVLRGVDLEVPAGSLTAVLGLSGCGKTTLLRVIAGFERAQRGEVSLAGRVLDDGRTCVPPEQRSVGYVPQEGSLFPHLSVQENVGFGLSRAERRGEAVADLLEMVGIAALARRLPHELSGGEQQRVALARALARRPQALLLDEPFSSLDASLRSRVREEVHELLREQGVTTVLVTHDQEEALSLADVVAVLRDGRIVQQGSPAELYERPADERLARFLGEVNVIDARFEGETARTALGVLELRRGPAGAGIGPAVGADTGAVLVRPEQLDVRTRAEGTPASSDASGLAGRVEQCRYYGHDALLHIRAQLPGAADGPELLLARVPGEHALALGTPVSVSAHGPVTPLP